MTEGKKRKKKKNGPTRARTTRNDSSFSRGNERDRKKKSPPKITRPRIGQVTQKHEVA